MIVVDRQPPSHGLTTPVGRFCGSTRWLSVRLRAFGLTPSALRRDGLVVCLHALSSFQRTDRLCARGAQPPERHFRLEGRPRL